MDVFKDEPFSGVMTPVEDLPFIDFFEEAQAKKLKSKLDNVPAYLKINDDLHPVDDCLLRLMNDIRCRTCVALLCCGEHTVHHVNCWVHDLLGQLIENEVMSIPHYHFDVLAGKLNKYSHYIYGFFNAEKHVQADKPFNAARLGLNVRCFTCKRCSTSELDCRLSSHDHKKY